MKKKIILILFLIIFSIISIGVGSIDINIKDIFIEGTISQKIIFLSRFPRTISIIIAGFGMSIAGLIMQGLTMNKFVSPTTAGTADGAKFGVLVALLIFPSSGLFFKMIIALIFSLIGTIIFLKITSINRLKDRIFVPLVGLMLGGVINAITTFFAYRSDVIQSVDSFLFGNFSGIISGNYELLYLSIPLIILAFFYAKKFAIAGMGKDFSTNLGISYDNIVRIGFIIVCTVASLIIVTVGAIPFLGLIVPNIVTIFMGDNLSKNIFITGLFGSIFLLVCDILGRVIILPYELPIGMVVGVIGSGIFLYMIIRRSKCENT